MSISEQVKELRKMSQRYPVNIDIDLFERTLNQAADTIESLSAKLQAANMEQSGDCGGWIPCEERLPEESGYYDVTIESKINDEIVRTTERRCFHTDMEFWEETIEPEFAIDEMVIAWRYRPEPYHEP